MALDFISLDSINDINSDILVFSCNEVHQGRVIEQMPEPLREAVQQSSIFAGKQGQHLWLTDQQWPNTQLLCMGSGDDAVSSSQQLSELSQAAITLCQHTQLNKVTLLLANELDSEKQADASAVTAIAISQLQYAFNQYKENAPEDSNMSIEFAFLSTLDDQQSTRLTQANAIAEAASLARDLANQPGNVCTPAYLANTAEKIAATDANSSCKVFSESEIDALGMGAFYSVAKGSSEEAKLAIIEYRNNGDAAPVALVGKGVTFDTGGISLKPGAKMDEMKFDMCGAASVLATAQAVIAMQLPINAIFAIATAENMPNGNASKPGDIVTSYKGKTIEVLNTDAEGRLILCDTLTYIEEQYQPSTMVDIATLTGACIVALGHHTSAVMSYDDGLADQLMACGDKIEDSCWRLPLGEAYKAQLKSEFADLGNIGGPAAGSVTAGCFLGEFVDTDKTAWAHLDIAGTAWTGKASTGRPVPLLCQFMIEKSQA